MTLAQAEAFLILAEELHFGRTAERLILSQARVSRLIASLELEVGGALFERTSRRVRITPLGEHLRNRLSSAIVSLNAGLDETRAMARGVDGRLRIGFTPTTRVESLGRLIAAFEQSHPGCDVTESEVPLVDPYTALRNNEIDVLCNWLAVDESDLTAGPLLELHERVLAVASDSPLATREGVSRSKISEADRCPYTRASRERSGTRSSRLRRPPAFRSHGLLRSRR